jgi:hypothetical protein
MLYKSLLYITLGLALTACQNKKETIYLPIDKQADENLAKNFSSDRTQFKLNKSVLGKAYILTPYSRSSGRTPQWETYKPLIVSFEQQNAKLVVYNLTHKELYTQIKASNKVDSFDIIKESESELVIDFKQGFKSLPLVFSIAMVEKDTIDSFKLQSESGELNGILVKDSVLNEVLVLEKQIQLTQTTTVMSQIIEKTENSQGEEVQNLKSTEKPMTLFIDMKAYQPNPNFKPKSFDKNQNYGFFVNLASKDSKLGIEAQITKWDLNKKISVFVSDNTPAEIIPIVKESVEYWNKAMQTKAFEVILNHPADARPIDSAIYFRWVEWQDAGFAYAYGQADPLTGELFRAQVFMTSSWLQMNRSIKNIPVVASVNSENLNSIPKSALCYYSQSNFDSELLTMNSSDRTKKTLDTIRYVIIHELGHVMGLRHNFAGSFKKLTSDDDVAQVVSHYQNANEILKPVEITTSTMDYIFGQASGYIGLYAKNYVHSYDQSVVNWGYYNKTAQDVKSSASVVRDTYCSDEHTDSPDKVNKVAAGCLRNDLYSNQFYLEKMNINNFFNNTVANSLIAYINFIKIVEDAITFQSTQNGEYYSIDIDPKINIPDEVIYEVQEKKYISLVRAKELFNSMLQGLPLPTLQTVFKLDSSAQSELNEQLKDVGGLSGVLKHIYIYMQNEKFNPKQQADVFFSKYSAESLDLNPILYSHFKSDFYKKINANPPKFSKIAFEYLPTKEASIASKHKFAYSAELGDAKELVNLYSSALTESTPKEFIYSTDRKLKIDVLDFQLSWTHHIDEICNLTNWPISYTNILTIEFGNDFHKFKQELRQKAQKPIEILAKTVFKSEPKSWSGADLEAYLLSQDWSKLSGFKYEDLNGSLYLIKHLDKIQ